MNPAPQAQKLTNLLQEHSIAFEKEALLNRYTTFQTGGRATLLAHPVSPGESDMLFQYALQNEIDFFILGGGSNLLISDEGLRGLIIKPEYPKELHILEESTRQVIIQANASNSTSWFSREMAARGFSGAQFLATIPGTLGGALIQNAGCYGGEMSQIVKSAFISEPGKMHEIKDNEMELSYRHSTFKSGKIVLIHTITFQLTPGIDPGTLQKEIEQNKQMRLQSQPKNRRSAGSVFKNPPGQKAWQLIEAAGCKGMSIGGALLSPEHANFIINTGNANSNEIYQLIQEIQKRVKDQSGVELQPEIMLVGKF